MVNFLLIAIWSGWSFVSSELLFKNVTESISSIAFFVFGMVISNLIFILGLRLYYKIEKISVLFISVKFLSFLITIVIGASSIRDQIWSRFYYYYFEPVLLSMLFFYTFKKYFSSNAFTSLFTIKKRNKDYIIISLSIFTYAILTSITQLDQMLTFGTHYKEYLTHVIELVFATCLYLHLKDSNDFFLSNKPTT